MAAGTSDDLRNSPDCKIPDISPSQLHIVGNISFHHLVIYIGTICAALAILITFGQFISHAARCYRLVEQKYVMRVLLVIPGFAIFFTLGSWFYPSFAYISNIPDIIEAFSFISLFELFVFMATETTSRSEQDAFFTTLDRYKRKKAYQMLIPSQRNKPSELAHRHGSLRWFRGICLGMYQFPVIKFIWTIIGMVLTYYICPDSKVGRAISVLDGVINSLSTSTALWSMIIFYARLRDLLKPRHAFRKAFIFKKMIGIILFQSSIMSWVSGAGGIVPTPQMSYGDYTIGIPTFMTQAEMLIYSLIFLWCFNVSEFANLAKKGVPNDAYSEVGQNTSGPKRAQKVSFFRALLAVIDISDFLGALITAFRNIPAITRKERTVRGYPAMKMSPNMESESGLLLPDAAAPGSYAYALQTLPPPQIPTQANVGALPVSWQAPPVSQPQRKNFNGDSYIVPPSY